MKKILFLDTTHPFLKEELERQGYRCVLNNTSPRPEIEKIVHGYEGIIVRSRLKIDRSLIDKSTKLKFIGRVVLIIV